MFCINWLYLDWHTISAWTLAILVVFYLIIRLNNYFLRWSITPPQFLQPNITCEKRLSSQTIKITQINIEKGVKQNKAVAIWVIGKCPRFLRNIAYCLNLFMPVVYINELKPRINLSTQPETVNIDNNHIFFGRAINLEKQLAQLSPNTIHILVAPQITKDLKVFPNIQQYLILGKKIKQKEVQRLEREGFHKISLAGGTHFRDWELPLLAELLRILNRDEGVSK